MQSLKVNRAAVNGLCEATLLLNPRAIQEAYACERGDAAIKMRDGTVHYTTMPFRSFAFTWDLALSNNLLEE